MSSIQYDLSYLAASIEALESYLLAQGLYWPVGASAPAGEPDFPSLTLGGVLLARKRLAGQELNLGQQAQFTTLCQEMDAVHKRWQVAWERKSQRSFHARLNQWRNFLVDYGTSPQEHAARYSYEVRLRVMLALLAPDAGSLDPAELELLGGLDQLVRGSLEPGGFAWEADLAGAFPMETWWYLYGSLKERLAA